MDFSTYMVPAVAVATYLVCAVLKRFMGENSKYLPLVAAMLGVVGIHCHLAEKIFYLWI